MRLIDILIDEVNIRRASWPEGDYIQIIRNSCKYFDHKNYRWVSNYVLKPEDTLATDWQVKK